MTIKKIITWFVVWLIGVILNFSVFLYSYKQLAFPYLHEEQRVENAPYIFGYVLPTIMLISLVLIILFFIVTKKERN